MFRDRVGYGSGVASMESLLVVVMCGFFSMLAAQYLLFSKIKKLFVNLDLQLAATIGKLLEEMPFRGYGPRKSDSTMANAGCYGLNSTPRCRGNAAQRRKGPLSLRIYNSES